MLMIKDLHYSNHKTFDPVAPSTKTEAQTRLFLTWSLGSFHYWEMREICYLTFDPIVLLNVFPQFESNLIYGLPSNRINQPPLSSVCFPLTCKLKQATSLTPDINCHCIVYILSATPSWRDREGTTKSCCLLPASMTGVSVLAKLVYGLSLKCFSWEALHSDFIHQGFLSIWNSFTVFCVGKKMVAWCGMEDHIVEENMFSNWFQLQNMGSESSTFCTLQCFASDPVVHPCLWVAKRGVLVRSSQDVWLHTGNIDTSAVVIFLVVILFLF